MGPPNIKDLLTSFSSKSDFLAISSGDGRIKVWDTLKGQVQTEFADITSTDGGKDLYNDSGSGHLSLDYTCMKWLPLEKKKKRKIGCSLLVLGTGSGDVLAFDVSAGQLKWRLNDCHPGGVNAISFSADRLCIYTAGVDGMICQTDPASGSLLEKFKASTKAISSMVLSHDGKILATAAGQLKVFSCSDNKKIQKFSGHPGAVRCMIFTEDCKYVLSSAVGEKSIAVWKIDGSKKQSASCVLSMEHPAVFLDSKCADSSGADDAGLYVLAISELGVCYFWYGRNIEELRNTKPTRISLSPEAHLSKYHKRAVPMVFAAELKGIVKPGSGQVFLAYGSLVKPSFEKVLVQYGVDIILNSTQDGILLPIDQAQKSQKGQKLQTQVTALDRANAEDALLPIPKLHEFKDKKRRHEHSTTDPDEEMTDNLMNKSKATSMVAEDDEGKVEEDSVATCMEDQLRSSGILSNKDDPSNLTLSSTLFNDEYFEANISQKKINAAILSMESEDAYKLLTFLVNTWKSRPGSAKHVLPWISTILVKHSQYIISQEQYTPVLDSWYKLTKSKCIAVQPLIQLSGRMQLVMAQINKAGNNKIQTSSNDHQLDESESESEDEEDVDEFVYKEEESESQSDSEDDI